MLLPGDPVPSFYARTAGNPRYAFDSVAGRYVVVTFLGSSGIPGIEGLFAQLRAAPGPFDDLFACAFMVVSDKADEANGTFPERYPGMRTFFDPDFAIARLFGCLVEGEGGLRKLALNSFIIDPGMRVLRVIPVEDPATHHEALFAALRQLPPPREDHESWAPVLQIPNVLEPDFCDALLRYSDAQGMDDSGFMKTDPATGRTVMVVDHHHKRRSDCSIEDETLRQGLQARVLRRLVPQIERAFQFRVTRMERYLIARYDADSSGHFRPHKDNTTLGTAHRRFAVSIGLNAGDYEGGDLRFPEFGMRTYRPPSGGAIVFSCSLLHEAMPVTRGSRYVVLPFLYDEAAAEIRLRNADHLDDAELRKSVIASVTAVPGR